jgi:hypothetical protein
MWSALLVLALAPVAIGCGAGWRQPATLSPGPMPSRQQVQVWSGDHARRWHAVAVTEDSISGVPFTESPTCPACRVAIARTAVDSVRLGNPVAGFWKTVGLVLGGSVVLMGVWCESQGSCHVGN